MISLAAKRVGSEAYYLERTCEYYTSTSGYERPGFWWLDGAAPKCGLVGNVKASDLTSVFEGFLPDENKTKLAKSAGMNSLIRKRLAATDLVVTDPKGLSILRVLVSPEIRDIIDLCRRDALNMLLADIQKEVVARTGKDGAGEPIHGKLLVSIWEHQTNRKSEPLAHKHVLIKNTLLCDDGQFRSFDPKLLYQRKMEFGARYRMELARLLQERLGLEFVRMTNAKGQLTSLIELKAFVGPFAGLRDALSSRRKDLLTVLKEKGIAYTAKAAAKACLVSRPAKQHISFDDLQRNTRKVAEQHMFTDQTIREMIGAAAPKVAAPEKVFAEAIREVRAKLETEGAHWSGAEIQHEVYVAAQCKGLSAGFLQERLNSLLKDEKGSFVRVGEAEGLHQRYSTRMILAVERKMFATMDEMQVNRVHAVSEASVDRRLSKAKLNAEQKAACRYVTAQSSALACVTGYAGTGKSRLLREANQIWRDAGMNVIGLAPTGKATEGLANDTGITCYTVAKFLGVEEFGYKGIAERTVLDATWHDLRMLWRAALGKPTWQFEQIKLTSNDVVVVDESSQLNGAVIAQLVRLVFKAGAKLVLCGDPYQLESLFGSAPFRAITEKYGAAHLTKIERQHDCFARRIVKLLSGGRHRALVEMARRGLLHVADTRQEAAAELVKAYAASGLKNCMEKIALAATNEEVAFLNREIKKSRAAFLGWKSIRVNANTRVHVNDVVIFRKNNKHIGVSNGTRGTVQGIDLLNRTIKVRLSNAKVVRVPLNRYDALNLGYAATSYFFQGTTVNEAFSLAGGSGSSRRQLYVDGSRSRKPMHWFLGRDDAGPELTRLAGTLKKEVSRTPASSQEQAPTPRVGDSGLRL